MDAHLDRLKSSEPFCNFGSDVLQRVFESADVRTFAPGDTIVSKTRDFTIVQYLLSGGVEVRTSFFEREEFNDSDPQAKDPLEKVAAAGVAITASSECLVARFHKSELEAAIAAPKTKSAAGGNDGAAVDDNWMEHFLLSPLVSHLDASDISQLLASISDIPVKKGQLVIKPGVPGDCFYIIKQGTALVRPMGSTDKVIVKLEPGAQFGEEALVAETVRNAKIVMATDGMLGRIKKDFFNSVIKNAVILRVPEAELEAATQKTEKFEILDVRLFPEFNASHRENARNLPVSKLRANFANLDRKTTYFITPEGAKRSELATFLLRQAGFNAMLIEAAA